MALNKITSPKATMIMLIGPPGSGKSTYINDLLMIKNALCNDNYKVVVISTDDIFEELAKDAGITYTEAFDKFSFKEIEREMFNRLDTAIKENRDIIIDQTNMSVKSRARKLQKFPSNYHKEAVVFNVDRVELDRRLNEREKETGKIIPKFVVDSMLRSYQEPTKAEGFDLIKYGTTIV